ncbi:MATE family efflux transporter [Clostridium sp. OM02-18AC]|uniref:MATE family efflux transporter n=1 Tax=Clostridium sp. OM02-18AC TaxID=2292311 RepID=UPI000E476E69|nr:MATE family efflux transporter [Clostridium sp. OM02-18AC]RHV63820.1 MATE family efflux transporter [Clostridium sp. OM02-18AC]
MTDTFMKEKPVFPLLLSMALPMVVSMLVNSLYNIIDSFFVAKISENAMTALSLVYPVQNFINAAAIGFGVGINALVSLYLGAGDKKKAGNAAGQGLLCCLAHGVVLAVLSLLIMPHFLSMFTSDEAVKLLAIRYVSIAFSFAPVIMAGLFFEKLFQAVGRMKAAMASLLCGCIANIILDPLMIFGIGIFPAMGITGAAIATGIGQVVSLAVYLVMYVGKPFPVKFSKKDLLPNRPILKKLYGIGVPAILNLALPSILISALNGILAASSDCYVLVLGIYYKLQTFLYLPASGIVQGLRPLIGYNYGAKEMKRVRRLFELTLVMCAVIMAVGTFGCLLFAKQLMQLFTTNPETVAAGTQALRLICLGFLISSVSVTASGAFEGLGMGMSSLIISLCRYLVVILPAAWILNRIMGPVGVWHGFWISEWISAAVSACLVGRFAFAAFRER